MRKIAVAAILLFLTLVIVVGVPAGYLYMIASIFDQSSGPFPSDAQMIAHWRTHRATLERLAAMLNEDRALARIGDTWTDPDPPGVSAERLALYRRLMREAKILVAENGGPYDRQVTLVYYTVGLAIAGSAKSFCFGPPPNFLDAVVDDLDKARADYKHHWLLQRRIDGDWWLQYEG